MIWSILFYIQVLILWSRVPSVSAFGSRYYHSGDTRMRHINNQRNHFHTLTFFILNSKQNISEETSGLTTDRLTNQERILKKALGIEPETDEEKQARIASRQSIAQSERSKRRNNILVALLAFLAAIFNYGYQFTHPVTSLSLLTTMQRESADLSVIGKNGKPTVVDFWAPWCENCKASAPTLYSIEEEYKDRVNFVLVNGDLGENWPIIERFGVDAIPHLAMISSDGYVETALIGPIPRRVLRADLDTMIENHRITSLSSEGVTSEKSPQGSEGTSRLPYVMYDAFRSQPELRRVNF